MIIKQDLKFRKALDDMNIAMCLQKVVLKKSSIIILKIVSLPKVCKKVLKRCRLLFNSNVNSKFLIATMSHLFQLMN